MSDDLERRLRDALGGLPGPDATAGERARRAALGSLPPGSASPRRRWRRTGVLATAAAITVVLTTGLGLAATGNLDVRVGPADPAPSPAPPPPAPTLAPVELPEPLRGVAVQSGTTLIAVGQNGFRLEARASAADLSPNALFVAAGLGRSLVALAPNGREAWRQPTEGVVVAAAWSPNPLPILIAYVVRTGEGHALWLIEGDGENARLIDPDVAPVRPSWHEDLFRVAYVGADAAVRVYDRSRARTLTPEGCVGDARAVAFAPAGDRLAVIGGGGARLGVLGLPGDPAGTCLPDLTGVTLTDLAWLSAADLVTSERAGPGGVGSRLRRFATGGQAGIAPRGTLDAGGARLLAVARAPAAEGLTVLARPAGGGGLLAVWLTEAPGAAGGDEGRLRPRVLLSGLPAGASSAPPTLSAQ